MSILAVSYFLSLLATVFGLGPPFTGEDFLRQKELPPAAIVARTSGSVTLTCSVAGTPTPTVAWFRDGLRLAGTQTSPGGLGETWAKLHLPCIDENDGGVYECRGEGAGTHVSSTTKVEVIGHPHSGCLPRGRGGSPPVISGWHNTVMVQSGHNVRLACNVNESSGKVQVVWRDGMGREVKNSETMKAKGSDLYITGVDWSHMGRFTCTAKNGFGVDMVSTFLYPLAPALPELSNMV